MRHRLVQFTTGLVVLGGTLATALVALVLWPPPWKSGEYLALALWSLPLAVAVALIARVLRRWLAGRSAVLRAVAATCAGVFLGAGWAFTMYLISSGAVMAFDAPVLPCWSIGSVLGLLVGLFWPDMRRPDTARPARELTIGIVTAGVLMVSFIAAIQVLFARPADLLIHVASGAAPEQIQTIWSEVLGIPDPSGRGFAMIDGVQNIGECDGEGEVRLRVGFFPGTSVKRRAAIVERVLASPLVTGTTDLEAGSSTAFSGEVFPEKPK